MVGTRTCWIPALAAASLLGAASTAVAQGLPADPPTTEPSLQKQFGVQLAGVSAVQLTWWFQHLADEGGIYFKDLAPSTNRAIEWVVTPTDDAHHIIGSIFRAEQQIPEDYLSTTACRFRRNSPTTSPSLEAAPANPSH